MRVHHKYFGAGIVLSQKGGEQLLVDFDCGIRLWVNRNTLLIHSPPAPLPIKSRPASKGKVGSRKIVEALRMGIVPYFATKEFTFGRGEQIEQIREEFKCFQKEGGGCILIEGEYGAGKTHLLDYIHRWALEEGYGVCRCELDAEELSPSRPKRVYRELLHSLRLLREEEEWGGERVLKEGRKRGLSKHHTFFSKAFEVMKKGVKSSFLWDWISGEPLSRDYLDWCKEWRLPVLLDHSPAVDIYCYLLSGWSYILSTLGAKGFLIIMDEAETIQRLYWREREVGSQFYKGLFALCKNEEHLLSPKFKEQKLLGLGRMDEHGLLHSGVRPTPYAYHLPSKIMLIIALTPLGERVKEFEGAKKITLPPLSPKDLKDMTEKMVHLYKEAFHFHIREEEKKQILGELLRYHGRSIRYLIRRGVESMDILRHYERD